MATKLIIVEGLPGSGKSTAAQKVHGILKCKGINSELYQEGNYNHPADFDGVAYMNSNDFHFLKQVHPTSVDLLDKIKINFHNGYIIPYRKAIEEQKIVFEQKLFHDITKNDIYELPIEMHTQLILNRWNNFANDHANESKVAIFECCFIQNPVTVSMIKNNSPKEVTMGYVDRLAQIIKPLEPVLIYVEQESIEVSFNRAICERPNEWINGFTHYYTNQGYGLSNNLRGLEGVIEILKVRNGLEKEIYESLKLIKYRINNSEFNLDLLKARLGSIIEAHL